MSPVKRAFTNVSWLFLSQVGRIVTQLLGVSIIARLLTPGDFGVIAVAFMVSNLAGLLRDMGTGPAAIRSRDGSQLFLGGIYSAQLTISIILAVVILLLAMPMSQFYHMDTLARVLILFAVVFPVSALGGVHLIVLERAQRYREISMIELFSYIVGLAVAVIFARVGLGVESLAYQAVTNALVQTVLMRKVAAVRIVPTHPRNARSAAGGSVAVSSYHLLNYVVRNSDIAIAGRLAQSDFVGAYSMANRIAQMPSQLIGMLVARVSVPMLAGEGLSRNKQSQNVEILVGFALVVGAAVCLVLVSLRQNISALVFGPQWLTIVPPQLVWLLPAAALTSTTAVLIGVMTALGAKRQLTGTGLSSAACHLVILVAIISVDIKWLPSAILLSAIISFALAVLYLRSLQTTEGLTPIRLICLLPGMPLIAFPIWQDTMFFFGELGTRGLSTEITQSAISLAVLFLFSVLQWHKCIGRLCRFHRKEKTG